MKQNSNELDLVLSDVNYKKTIIKIEQLMD